MLTFSRRSDSRAAEPEEPCEEVEFLLRPFLLPSRERRLGDEDREILRRATWKDPPAAPAPLDGDLLLFGDRLELELHLRASFSGR